MNCMKETAELNETQIHSLPAGGASLVSTVNKATLHLWTGHVADSLSELQARVRPELVFLFFYFFLPKRLMFQLLK